MTGTRASWTACCATILTAVDRTPPKNLPSSEPPEGGRHVVKMRGQALAAGSAVWAKVRKF